jgi:hypothetical protein
LYKARERSDVSSSLTNLIILMTVIHVAAFAVMIWIRLRPDQPAGIISKSARITLCALCSEPATRRSYDGLDPGEQHDPHTGRPYSIDLAHYQPLCAEH